MLDRLINATPSAIADENRMPIAVSSCSRPFLLSQPIVHAMSIEKTAAASSGSTPAMTPMAMPPNAECEMPTPMNDKRFRTTKKPRTPHSNPTSIPAIRARCTNP